MQWLPGGQLYDFLSTSAFCGMCCKFFPVVSLALTLQKQSQARCTPTANDMRPEWASKCCKRSASFTRRALCIEVRFALSDVLVGASIDRVCSRHSDIKPANFCFASRKADAPIKLIDFGLALRLQDDEVQEHGAGTPHYMVH